MIVSIHQPAYIPWLGYFDKIAHSDMHVFLDDAEYSKNNLFNRNKIKTPKGEIWLTIPVHYQSDKPIKEIEIDNHTKWAKKHWDSIKMNYSKAKYFKVYAPQFEGFYSREWKYLVDITMEMNKMIAGLFGIKTGFVRASEIQVEGKQNERLIGLCKTLQADTYLSGKGAKAYMDDALFASQGIKVIYQDFVSPTYTQLWGTFIPGLSSIDFLFNCGADEFRKLS